MKRPELGEQFADFAQQDHTLRFGMWVFLASEVLLFAALFALYGSYRAMYGADFQDAVKHNTLRYGTVNTYILLTSSLTVALSVWSVRGARYRLAVTLLLSTILLGVAFLVVKTFEYLEHIKEGALPGAYYHLAQLPTYGANRFYTLYWVMTGLHAVHVTGGIIVLAWLTWRAAHRFYTPERHVTLEMGTLYWHLVDVIWIFLWPILYLA
ncbi:MAG TPA: cytochrome c oxidase subunit 3 [Polyangia bacterium]|nr:cytochrome c oxidase subunit 3 [Polyangia bacterium]